MNAALESKHMMLYVRNVIIQDFPRHDFFHSVFSHKNFICIWWIRIHCYMKTNIDNDFWNRNHMNYFGYTIYNFHDHSIQNSRRGVFYFEYVFFYHTPDRTKPFPNSGTPIDLSNYCKFIWVFISFKDSRVVKYTSTSIARIYLNYLQIRIQSKNSVKKILW